MHSKSWKNHKIENKDVLESLWLDLCNEPIIWHMLVEKYCPIILSMLVRDKIIYVVMLLLLLWNFMVGYSCDVCSVIKISELLMHVWLSYWFKLDSA